MRGARFTRKDRARRSRAVEGDEVRCEHVDPLTEVIVPGAIVSAAELERLRAQLTDSLRRGIAFVVVDLRSTPPDLEGLDRVLADAAGPLARRDGGLAVVGCHEVRERGGVDVFCDRAEALAGVRGRLTPRRSISRSPMRRRVVAP
jgi:hypothetical protein